MFSLTRKIDYALVAMADLARRAPDRTSARAIAESSGVPLPMLTNILHLLLQGELVTSVLGAKGGYCLAKPPDEISLAELINAVEGQFRLVTCCDDGSNSGGTVCDLEVECGIKGPVQRVHSILRSLFDQVTLAHIAFDTVPVSLGVPGGGRVWAGDETSL